MIVARNVYVPEREFFCLSMPPFGLPLTFDLAGSSVG
jgi:hypothetical protein